MLNAWGKGGTGERILAKVCISEGRESVPKDFHGLRVLANEKCRYRKGHEPGVKKSHADKLLNKEGVVLG